MNRWFAATADVTWNFGGWSSPASIKVGGAFRSRSRDFAARRYRWNFTSGITSLDSVIANGTIYDGHGGDPYIGDVAVRGDRILAVGSNEDILNLANATTQQIDARGMTVTPGFIDGHTHMDAQVYWDPIGTCSSYHGITSVVMGNCGVGFAPAAPDRHEWLIGLMEGVEDIPGTALYEGMEWGQWESFPDYMDYIASRRYSLDIGAQVEHRLCRVRYQR